MWSMWRRQKRPSISCLAYVNLHVKLVLPFFNVSSQVTRKHTHQQNLLCQVPGPRKVIELCWKVKVVSCLSEGGVDPIRAWFGESSHFVVIVICILVGLEEFTLCKPLSLRRLTSHGDEVDTAVAMFTFTPLLGAQSGSPASQSLLEFEGGVKVLIDVGWDESFDVEKLRELER